MQNTVFLAEKAKQNYLIELLNNAYLKYCVFKKILRYNLSSHTNELSYIN